MFVNVSVMDRTLFLLSTFQQLRRRHYYFHPASEKTEAPAAAAAVPVADLAPQGLRRALPFSGKADCAAP